METYSLRLSNKPETSFIVDEEDFHKVKKYNWQVVERDGKAIRVCRFERKNGFGRNVLLHRQILGVVDPKLQVDHINGNILDNRRSNLRICSIRLNTRNRCKPVNNKSGYKGVMWRVRSQRFEAKIKVDGKQIHLGSFTSIIEAAEAYDKGAVEHFGEFARTNKDLGLI